MHDLTKQVDLIILGGGQAGASAAEALSRDGVSVMLCDLDAVGSGGLSGRLVGPRQDPHVTCVAHLSAGRGVRIEAYK